MDSGSSYAPWRLPGFGVGISLGLVGLIVGLSLAFATGSQTQQYAEEADLVQASQEVLTVSAIIRSEIGAILVLTESRASGQVVGGLDDALGQLAISTGELQTRVNAWLPLARTEAATARVAVNTISTDVDALIVEVERSSTDAAEKIAIEQILPSLSLLNDAMILERDGAATRLTGLRTSAGTLARIASLGVALLLPGIGFVLLRASFRRRQRQEALLADLQRERHAVKTKDDFINSLSHELRTPLTSIFGFAVIMDDMLARGGHSDPAFLGESTKVILSEAAELNRMVDDLLTHAKKKSGVFHLVKEEAAIANVIAQSVDVFRRQGIDVTIRCDDAVLEIDTHHVTQMVRNLVSNAVKHGGPQIEIVGSREVGRYSISVIDDGAGVPPELAERLFTRFVHQDEAPLTTGSVGLGLFICKTLAEEMGGDLGYERRRDLTVFTVTLPLGDRVLDDEAPLAA